MNFKAAKAEVSNRGSAPDKFLLELVTWGKSADPTIFEVNSVADEIYTRVKPQLGPYKPGSHRRAVMLEVMRVHAGFESSWNWNEGVDITNKTSMANKTGQESGIFQVSFDSEAIHHGYMKPFCIWNQIDNPDDFISKMKSDHQLALEYYARLVRVNVLWAGPIARNEINPWLSRASVEEFQAFL